MAVDLGNKPAIWEVYDGQIAEMRLEGYTLQQIGEVTGVTRERIRQVLEQKFGRIEPVRCFEAEAARRIGCSACMLATLRKKGVVCPKRLGYHWLYDANEMDKAKLAVEAYRQRRKLVVLKCAQCGKEFELSGHEYNARLRRRKIPLFFCSRQCYGRYIALHYGFGVFPEHAMGPKRGPKWDYSRVYSLWKETGWSLKRLSIALGIPLSSIGGILRAYPDYKPRRTRGTIVKRDYGERECIGCGELIPGTRRSLFCSTKCYDRIRGLYRYYNEIDLGGRVRVPVTCSSCGAWVYREKTKNRHFCDSCLAEYRCSVGERLAKVKAHKASQEKDEGK